MQNGDRVQFVSCPELPAVTDSATFYYLQNSDKLYLGSQLIANNVKDVQNSETPGKLRITQFDGSTREIDIPGNAFGIDCYKGKFPLDFTSPGGAIDEWKIYGNSSGPTEVLETQSVLPTTITAHSGNAVDWEIYGNNNPVVENKTGDLPIEVSATAGNAVDWTIYGNDDNGTENLFDVSNILANKYITATDVMGNSTVSSVSNYCYVYGLTQVTLSFSGRLQNFSPRSYCFYDSNKTLLGTGDQYIVTTATTTFVVPSGAVYMRFTIDNGMTDVVLNAGSTAPDHYIPYQKGVGEQTENVCTAPTAQTKTNGALSVTADGQGRYNISISSTISTQPEVSFDLPEFTMPISVGQGGNGTFSMFNTVKQGFSIAFYYNDTLIEFWLLNSANRQTNTYISMGNKVCNKIVFRATDTVYAGTAECAIMFTNDSILPTEYIPYGYRIPLDIRHKTKNLVDITGFDRMLYGVRWYEDNGQLRASGTYTDSAVHTQPRFYAELNAGTYTMSGAPNSELAGAYLQIGTCTDEQGSNFSSLGSDTGTGYTFTLQEGSWVSIRVVTTASLYQQTVDLTLPIMLRLADTSPNFEPYYLTNHEDIYIGNSPLTQGQSITKAQSGQDIALFSGDNIIDTTLVNKPQVDLTYRSSVLGVGERTGNEFNVDIVQGYYNTTNGIFIPNSTRYVASGKVSIIGGQKYTLSFDCDKQASSATSADGFIYFWNNDMYINGTQFTNKELCTFTAPSDANTFAFIVGAGSGGELIPSDVTNIMLVKGSTVPTSYIPFGYKIPLLVTSGQQSTPHTIYIGDSPLTEGQSVSKTSSGTDIALYQGENTMSTTLGNKPEMRIDYLSTVVGVGIRTGNLIEGKIANTNINANGQIISNPNFNTWVAPIEQGVTYTFTSDTATYAEYTEYPVLGSVAYNNTRVIATTTFTATIDGYIAFRASTNYATAMCIIGSTPPSTYIPYGYQIPIDIKQGDEIVDHKDIYIGTQPLIEGDYINQTGVYRRLQQFVDYVDSTALPEFDFIPITEQLIARNGENTITTSLVNNATIDVELHPTTQAAWICGKLEALQRRIDNVDSTLGAPERRNYLVTWCSEARLAHTGTSDAPLTTAFTNSFESADFASALTISGTSYATGEFMQTVDLLAMVTNYAHYYVGSSNYTVARPGDYVVIIYNTVCSTIAANQSILLQIVQNDNAVITQALTDGYVGCVPFKILNLDFSRTITQVRLIVESADAWTTLNCQIDIAIVNASMIYQDSAALVDTDPRLSSMSLYDTVISANQQFQVSLTDLTARVEALEQGGGGGSTYNETQTDTVTDAVEEVTQ